MKKMIAIAILLTFTLYALAPNTNTISIPEAEEINPYRDLISAIGWVECQYDTLAYNPEEEATGYFQIRPIRVEHYNRLTGNNYTLEEMYEYDKAERVFLYFAEKIGPYDLERIAKNWNGSGPKTIEYWKRVKTLIK